MYEIAWLQFVIKIVHQEMHNLQKLNRCDDRVELLGLFESSARDSVTKSCSSQCLTNAFIIITECREETGIRCKRNKRLNI